MAAPDFWGIAPVIVAIGSGASSIWAVIQVTKSRVDRLEQEDDRRRISIDPSSDLSEAIDRLDNVIRDFTVLVSKQNEVHFMMTKTLDSLTNRVESLGTEMTKVSTSLSVVITKLLSEQRNDSRLQG